MHKRLEKGTFAWPNTQEEARLVSLDDIKRILRGENIFRQHLSYIFDKRAKGCRLCLYSSLCPTSFWVYKEEKFKQDWFNFYGDYDNSIEYILKESK